MSLTSADIKITFVINLITGGVFFILGLFWNKIYILRKPFVRWFFGKGITGGKFSVVHGTIIDSRVVEGRGKELRFVKRFHDGRSIGIVGPWGNAMGDSEIRATSYIISTLSKFRNNPIDVCDDQSAIKDLNGTYISIGSSSSNEISDLALREDANSFLVFEQDDKDFYIKVKSTGKKFVGFTEENPKDYGLIVKIPNVRFPNHYFIVCAGLGDYGTSGATWYLMNKWKSLPWSRNGFGVVVEVESGSDTSARIVYLCKKGK